MQNEAITLKNTTHKKKSYLHISIFLYWAILVVWQNIGEYTARTTIDTMLKTGLLGFLTISYIIYVGKNQKIKPLNLALFTVFMLTQLITLFFEPSLELSTVVAYVFPLLFLFLSCVYGDGYKINKKQYVAFLNCVIAVAAYTAIYAIFFESEHFTDAFSISSAYGNELTSFFISNHEYGMYLLAGIISSIVCLEFKKDKPLNKKIIYILCILLFVPNLILTYSRTSILAMVGFLVMYVLFRGKSQIKAGLIFMIIAMIFSYAIWEPFREFILKIVLKDNDLAGRDNLYQLAIDFYKESDFLHQIFGSGMQVAKRFFSDETSHGSVHNGYLQVLVYYGAVGLIFMVSFILNRINASIKLVKKDRFVGTLVLGLAISCALLMFTNTTVLFNSPIDSFFLTSFFIVIPKYLENDVIGQKET